MCHLNRNAHNLDLIILLVIYLDIICHCHQLEQLLLRFPTQYPPYPLKHLHAAPSGAPPVSRKFKPTRNAPTSSGSGSYNICKRSSNCIKESHAVVFACTSNAATAHKVHLSLHSALAFSSGRNATSSTNRKKRAVPPTASKSLCTKARTSTTVTSGISKTVNNTATYQEDKNVYMPPAPNIIPRASTHNKAPMISMTTRQGSVALKKIEELRLSNKKKNDEARKLQEEEDKRRMDEATEARRKQSEGKDQARVDLTPKNLHDILNGAGEGDPEGMECSAGEETGSQEDERSPLKKRPVSSKSSSRRQGATKVTPPGGALSGVATAPAPGKSATFLDSFIYPYPRVILELAITLKSDKAFEEFTKALMDLLSNAQIVDPRFAINPIDPESKAKNITSKGEISPNMTKLGTHIKISGNGNAFNKKKVWADQNQSRKSRKPKKDEFKDPTVYFSMVVSTAVRPQELLDRITHEWARTGGNRLQIKDLQTIESETVVTFFRVSTLTPKAVILAELRMILLQAQKRASADDLDSSDYDFTLDEDIEPGESLPPMNLRVQVALLKGTQVNSFTKLSHQAQQARRSWHLEVDKQHARKMKTLIQVAKDTAFSKPILPRTMVLEGELALFSGPDRGAVWYVPSAYEDSSMVKKV